MTQAFDVNPCEIPMQRPKRVDLARWMAEIVARVSEETCVSPTDILGTRRHKSTAEARLVVCWIARHRGFSYPEIGFQLGRDHTTIMAAVKRVNSCARLLVAAEALAGVKRFRVAE